MREHRVIRELEVTLSIGALACLESRLLRGEVSERRVSTLRRSKNLRVEKWIRTLGFPAGFSIDK